MKLDETVKPIALGPGVACANGAVNFRWVAQRRVAIAAIVVGPREVADVIDSVGVTIVTHAPERAKITRFEDGSTISDMGISSITYAMKPSPEEPFKYLAPIPTDDEERRGHTGPNWFVDDGRAYMSAEVGEHVVVHVHNRSKEDALVSAVILYREIRRCERCDNSGVLKYATSGGEPYAALFCDCLAGQARR
jgi:hypothetical protein